MFRCFVPCCRGAPTSDSEKRTPQVVPTDESSVAAGESTKEVRKFAWGEVESLTGSFTAAVIGEGGFSTVYLARLPDSTPAAVKVQRSSERLHRAFLQERDVLLQVKHPNIVRLIGYSDDREEGVLVLEYVPNGTLHENLHGETPSTALTWCRRMSILYQVASAVDHLHDGCDLQIVHGDITASNVLLDGDLNAKLCDLGSARMGFSAAVKPSAAGYLLGSPGYADPHYLRTGIISKKSDVYSFGVLTWEMISGIPAVRSEDERMLTTVMRESELADMVDPRLGVSFDAGELEVMGEVAGACCGAQPGLRPSMAEIVRIMREKVKL